MRLFSLLSFSLFVLLSAVFFANTIYAQYGYSDSYSDGGYSDNTYTNTGVPPPSPATPQLPGGFGITVTPCAPGMTQPNIRLRWTMSWQASEYRIYFLDQSETTTTTTTTPGWTEVTSTDENGNPTGFIDHPAVTTTTTAPTVQGGFSGGADREYDIGADPTDFIVGHFYSFVIKAGNAQGVTYSNTTPYNPSTPGGWSHQLYGWTQMTNCGPPGNFTMTTIPSCASLGTSRVHLDWTQSAGATSYTVFYRPNGSTPENAAGSTSGLAYNIDSPTLTPGSTYQFLVSASNGTSTAFSTGGWSAPQTVRYCSNPTVNLTIDTGDIVKTISSGSSVQLNYSTTNTYNCTTSASPSVSGVTTPWTNIYPSNTAVSNPGSTSASSTMTLYNNATYPNGSYQFTLSCNNTNITGLAGATTPVSKTVTVNVTQTLAPFIQTTQGDVHSNKNINVPAQGQ